VDAEERQITTSFYDVLTTENTQRFHRNIEKYFVRISDYKHENEVYITIDFVACDVTTVDYPQLPRSAKTYRNKKAVLSQR